MSSRKLLSVGIALVVFGFSQSIQMPGDWGASFSLVQLASAQDDEEKDQPRRSKTVSNKVGPKLQEALDAMEAEQYSVALTVLERLLASNITPFEQATTSSFWATSITISTDPATH